jgi:hypothetical protein
VFGLAKTGGLKFSPYMKLGLIGSNHQLEIICTIRLAISSLVLVFVIQK